MTARNGNWMLTASGRRYWPADPRADEIRIEDIAAQTAKLCRFTGACREFYSVAEHSVLVSRLVEELGGGLYEQRVGLLHDATEAYINDINRPTKKGPRMEGYEALEKLNWAAVAKKFDLAERMPHVVHVADNYALFHEAAAIMPPIDDPEIREAWGMGLAKPEVLRPELIRCLDWREARYAFLERFKEVS